jgi:hypothetical protein
MPKPATGPRKPRKRRPTLRFRLDGEWWTVKVQRPPSKELCEGMTDFKKRVVYFHPRAIAGNLLGIVAHEVGHATMPCVDETHIRDHERVVSVVARWLANTFCAGKISIGQHRRDK